MKYRLFRYRFSSMGCPCEIGIYADSGREARLAVQAVKNEVVRLDHKYSHYRRDSYLHRVQCAATGPNGVRVDRETARLLDYADTQYRTSNGLFDVTAGALSKLWNRAVSLPREKHINEALSHTGWHRVSWDGSTLRLPEGMKIDPGGLVKEYAADRAALVLKSLGILSAFVGLGGDLHILGPHPDGQAWRTGIRSPEGSGEAIAALDVLSGGLASSGDYERFSEIDGKRYGHIINPKTGWPVNAQNESLQSVSALAPSCLLAGSITSLAILAGSERGLALLRECGLPWFAVGPDGTAHGTISSRVCGTSASSGWIHRSLPSAP